jgi:hypothetical protein
MKPIFDETIHQILNSRICALEDYFQADAIFYYGLIMEAIEKPFRDAIEELKQDNPKRNRLCIILNTPGGSAETVEKLVVFTRKHYSEVYFIIPDYAYSAGTIFCMSGDKIIMDYSSSLGPIDPQVFNGTKWVPALGYLDKVNEIIQKSINGKASPVELMMLNNLDLAELKLYEQAKDLTITLLKEWLANYKFKTWEFHRNGEPVTINEKTARAEFIANMLGDNNKWHSHGRSIGIDRLQNELKLKIDDYSDDIPKKTVIRNYNDMICHYVLRNELEPFLHSRKLL